MQIDWITTGAQIVNFLILVFLLRHFLYRPLIAAMDRREQRIADRLEEARKREDEADAAAREYRRRQRELERKRDELLAQARETADAERRRLVDEAREQVAQMRHRWQRDLEREQHDFLAGLMKQAGLGIMRVALRALRDLADRDLEQQLIAVFLRRLEELGEAERNALTGGNGPLRITTSFTLDPERRSALAEAMRERLGESSEFHFEHSPDLICGIELRRGGIKVGWTVAEYLQNLETRFAELLSPASTQRAAS